MTIQWAGPALDDLESIRAYLGRKNSRAVKKVLARVFDAVEALETTPWVGRIGRRPHSRELVLVDIPYIVAYRVRAGQVEVLRVLHTSRSWPRKLG